MVVSIEQHVEWITQCLSDMRKQGMAIIEADPVSEQEWMGHVDEIAHHTVFPKADSWYKGKTSDGREVFMPYVGGVGGYREKCEQIAAAGYEGFRLGEPALT